MGTKVKIEIAKHEHDDYYVIVINNDNILGRENQEIVKFTTKEQAEAFVEWMKGQLTSENNAE